MIAPTSLRLVIAASRPSSFADWRARLDREQTAPVIAIAGSRGKTSVLRAVESIFEAADLRFASWTNRGVEIEGQAQRGELGPWSRVLTRLHAGGLDVALREIDWATFQAVGFPGSVYPVVAISNLCGNSDACLATPETLLAQKALARIRSNIAGSGRLIVNANDFDLAEDTAVDTAHRYLIGVSPDAPTLRRHILNDGDACWIEDSAIVIHEDGETIPVVDTRELRWVRDGNIPFAVQNALMATAVARSCGIPVSVIAAGLARHDARPESMPGSFNVFDTGTSTIVIDRPMPSWFLRTSLRATGNLGVGHQLSVVGPMTTVPTEDLTEVGRLLGRNSAVIVIHGVWDPGRMALLRQGAATNEVPPIVVQAGDERSAIQQGLGMLRAGDLMLILAENAPAAVRLVASRVRRQANGNRASAGAA